MIDHLYTKSDIKAVEVMDRQKSGNLHIQFTVADEVNGKRISGLTSAIIIENTNYVGVIQPGRLFREIKWIAPNLIAWDVKELKPATNTKDAKCSFKLFAINTSAVELQHLISAVALKMNKRLNLRFKTVKGAVTLSNDGIDKINRQPPRQRHLRVRV
jgi:hypothetical protein